MRSALANCIKAALYFLTGVAIRATWKEHHRFQRLKDIENEAEHLRGRQKVAYHQVALRTAFGDMTTTDALTIAWRGRDAAHELVKQIKQALAESPNGTELRERVEHVTANFTNDWAL